MRNIKTNYLNVTLGQELILHQAPLFMLYYYNEYMIDKPDYVLDEVVFHVAIVHTSYLLFELIT